MSQLVGGLLGLGGAALGAFGGGSDTKTRSTLLPIQKELMSILSQRQMSRLGRWIDTPRGRVFEYNPEPIPEYSLPRVAGLTGLQQNLLQQGSDLSNFQNQVLANQNRGSLLNALQGYQPGNIGQTAQQLQASRTQPQFTSTPYAINPMAISGMGPGRPDIQQPLQYFHRRPTVPDLTVQADETNRDAFRGPLSRQSLAKALQVSRVRPRSFAAGGRMPKKNYQTGGDMPEADPNFPDNDLGQFNLVGELGPELHVTDSGRNNLVGEEGPELFNPNEAGHIVPNHQLPAQMANLQQDTGIEAPLPPGQQGLDIAQILMGLGQALQQGGFLPAEEPQQQAVTTAAPSAFADPRIDPATGAERTTGNILNPGIQPVAATGPLTVPTLTERQKDIQPSPVNQAMQENILSGNVPVLNVGQQVEAPTPPPGATGVVNQQPPPAEPVVQEPSPVVPSETDAQIAELPQLDFAVDPSLLPTMTGQEFFAQQFPDAFAGITQAIQDPQLAFQFDESEALRRFDETYGDRISALTQAAQADPSFVYDPDRVNELFRTTQFEPAMEQWFEDTVPHLKEQFVKHGNIMGSEVPRYITRQTQRIVGDLERIRAQMQQQGLEQGVKAVEDQQNRALQANSILASLEKVKTDMIQRGEELGIQAAQNMINNQQQAVNTMLNLAALPSQIGLTQARQQQIANEIDQAQIQAPVQFKRALQDIDLVRATTADIYDKLSTNPLISDKMAVENMIQLAYLDSMEGTALRQQMDTIGVAINNINKLAGLAGTEQLTVQEVLTGTYEDWVRAVGPENLTSATQILMQIMGAPLAENITTVSQGSAADLSLIGSLLGNLIGGGTGTGT